MKNISSYKTLFLTIYFLLESFIEFKKGKLLYKISICSLWKEQSFKDIKGKIMLKVEILDKIQYCLPQREVNVSAVKDDAVKRSV